MSLKRTRQIYNTRRVRGRNQGRARKKKSPKSRMSEQQYEEGPRKPSGTSHYEYEEDQMELQYEEGQRKKSGMSQKRKITNERATVRRGPKEAVSDEPL